MGVPIGALSVLSFGVLLAAHVGGGEDAEASYRAAIEAGDSDRWYDLAWLLAQQGGREEEAEVAYREAICHMARRAAVNYSRRVAMRGGSRWGPNEPNGSEDGHGMCV